MENQNPVAKYMTAKELSERWAGAVSTGTLGNWRCQKVGPQFVKFRSRVLYPIANIEAWESAQQVEGGAPMPDVAE